MSSAHRQPAGDGEWVTLIDGIQCPHRWLIEHTPQLYAAWRDADTPEYRRTVAARILRLAAYAESEPPPEVELTDARAWQAAAERIDRRLTEGTDWPPLASALARAAATGYDVAARLPVLAAVAPLPERHPARELHWRLLDDCPAGAGPLPPTEPSTGGPAPVDPPLALPPATGPSGNRAAGPDR